MDAARVGASVIETTKGGRPFVRCDHCGVTVRANMPDAVTTQSVPFIKWAAVDRGWIFEPKKGRPQKAKCAACIAGLCVECGTPNIPTHRKPHDQTAHHRTLAFCTEQAVQGFAPVPPRLHGAVGDALRDPVRAYYKLSDSWWNLRFARVENLDELAEVEHDATAQLLARVARVAAYSTWRAAWEETFGDVVSTLALWSPTSRAHRGPLHPARCSTACSRRSTRSPGARGTSTVASRGSPASTRRSAG